MNEPLAARLLAAVDLTPAEASLIAIVAVMLLVAIVGLEQRFAVFATIAGVIVLLLSASVST